MKSVIKKNKLGTFIRNVAKFIGTLLSIFLLWILVQNIFFRNTLPVIIVLPLTLSDTEPPYKLTGHTVVMPWASITINPGVIVNAEESATLYSYGELKFLGSKAAPVEFRAAKSGAFWRGIRLRFSEGLMKYVVISDAKVAISIVSSKATLSQLHLKNIIEAIYTRDAEINISHCKIDPVQRPAKPNINVIKFNRTLFTLENSTIKTPLSSAWKIDTIDIGNSNNGVIRNNTIYGSAFPDTDAVDIGDGSKNIEVSGNRIYDFADKAISVGQQSTAIAFDNVIIDCGVGLAAGDGAKIEAYRNKFVRAGIALSSHIDEITLEGSSVYIKDSMFYQCRKIYDIEKPSIVIISDSLSDTEILPGIGNIKIDSALLMDKISIDKEP